MSSFLYSIGTDDIWNFVKRPAFIIAYIAVMVLLMLLIVVAAIVNEKRLAAMTERLKRGAELSERETEAAKKATRFEMLRSIDEQRATEGEKSFVGDVTLAALCKEFRNFAAGKLGLYYDERTIREFVSGLAVSKFMILQGMSGTGKTSLAFAFGEFLANPSTIVPVQPMWKERSDLLGYYNEFTKRFNETPLLQQMYRAGGSKEMFITILDELNIARVEYYFAEILSLMEIPNADMRYLGIVSDKWETDPEGLKDGSIRLPDNMWFLGTANNDDSTFAISDKVYDRAMIIDLDRKAAPFEVREYRTMPITAEKFGKLVGSALASRGVSAEICMKLDKLDAYLEDVFHISFGNRIMRQIKAYLPVYVSCGGAELEALDDILAKKVLRKLETLNLSYRRAEADELCRFISGLFGDGNMERSLAYIRKMAR